MCRLRRCRRYLRGQRNEAETVPSRDSSNSGWLQKFTDTASPYIPNINDSCWSGFSTPGDAKVSDTNSTSMNN